MDVDWTLLARIANELRVSIISMLAQAKSGHPGSSLSAVDLLTVLWFTEIKDHQDHFILSKGHAVPALYAILAKKGMIPADELKTLRKTGSRLQGHPDRVRLPAVEASTGSLGQGLSVAIGLALGLQMEGKTSRVFCMLGDGETQEGQIWEAALCAPKFKLSNLCAILDNNNGQIDGYVSDIMPIEPIVDKWQAFGWSVIDIDGHDLKQIASAFQQARENQERGGIKPVLILARTVKGKGVSFMENKVEWHGVAPKADEAARAIDELHKNGSRRA